MVVHLAFLIVSGGKETTQAINVEGTLNAFRAAAEAGAQRFVYASSIAAYGFHPDNPVGITEDWPTRPADRLFYAQEKAELEHLLRGGGGRHPETELYLLRPPIVLGPDAVGGKVQRAGSCRLLRLRTAGTSTAGSPGAGPRPAAPAHPPGRRGRGAATLRRGGGPAGAYNIAADDVVSGVDVAASSGFLPLAVPGSPGGRRARSSPRCRSCRRALSGSRR